MAELADALDLGSSPERGGGSSPPFRTNSQRNNDPYTPIQHRWLSIQHSNSKKYLLHISAADLPTIYPKVSNRKYRLQPLHGAQTDLSKRSSVLRCNR